MLFFIPAFQYNLILSNVLPIVDSRVVIAHDYQSTIKQYVEELGMVNSYYT